MIVWRELCLGGGDYDREKETMVWEEGTMIVRRKLWFGSGEQCVGRGTMFERRTIWVRGNHMCEGSYFEKGNYVWECVLCLKQGFYV